MKVKLTTLNYLLCLSKTNRNELLYLLKENNALPKKEEPEILVTKETTFFGVKSILDLQNQRRWFHTEIIYIET